MIVFIMLNSVMQNKDFTSDPTIDYNKCLHFTS